MDDCAYCRTLSMASAEQRKNCDPPPSLVDGKWMCFWCSDEIPLPLKIKDICMLDIPKAAYEFWLDRYCCVRSFHGGYNKEEK